MPLLPGMKTRKRRRKAKVTGAATVTSVQKNGTANLKLSPDASEAIKAEKGKVYQLTSSGRWRAI
jgi:hypothetical protein